MTDHMITTDSGDNVWITSDSVWISTTGSGDFASSGKAVADKADEEFCSALAYDWSQPRVMEPDANFDSAEEALEHAQAHADPAGGPVLIRGYEGEGSCPRVFVEVTEMVWNCDGMLVL